MVLLEFAMNPPDRGDGLSAYVARILGGYGRVSHPFDAGVTSPSPQLPLMRAMLR